jgi:hypothetical protein
LREILLSVSPLLLFKKDILMRLKGQYDLLG